MFASHPEADAMPTASPTACPALSRRSRSARLAGWLLAGGILLSGHVVAAEAFQSIESIRAAAQAFLDAQFGQNAHTHYNLDGIDPRLQLKPCTQPLGVTNAQSNGTGGRITLKVSCAGDAPWRIYVPVTIRQMMPALVLTRPMAAGTVIAASDLSTREINVNQPGLTYLTDPQTAIGQTVIHPMQAGQLLTQQDLGIAQLIKRGDQVTLVAEEGGVQVSAQGIAQGNGGAGQRITVKNSRSGDLIQGIVVDAHTVKIP
ncbi:flagellar basal body P-ring formation chaperone FlgA [Halothiobacillus sp. DCM-1]|uniref:flagellar basal body P-ring formation chaperone FlgA n=1 Tax=Halothiobacillus sp. DCM-1 TaxID=3112558 RepID=UPI0032534A04